MLNLTHYETKGFNGRVVIRSDIEIEEKINVKRDDYYNNLNEPDTNELILVIFVNII